MATHIAVQAAYNARRYAAPPRSDAEGSPLLSGSPASSSYASLAESPPHWDHEHAGNRLRRYNVPHHMVRHLVPRALVPSRRTPCEPQLPPFRVTPEDSARGTSITLATQVGLGSFFTAGAIDAFAPVGPSFTNPSGAYNAKVGSACVVAAALGFTFVGATIGNLWYNALLTLSARNHSMIARHPQAAERTAAAFGMTTIGLCMVGSVWLGADLLARLQAAPPDGPAPDNVVYEYTLALLAITVGPTASACSSWYLGRCLGAAFGSVISPSGDEQPPSDLFSHLSGQESP